jgi:hypothetical protein
VKSCQKVYHTQNGCVSTTLCSPRNTVVRIIYNKYKESLVEILKDLCKWKGVDNHLARQEIHRIQGLHIDAGNGLDFGQVVLGNVDDADLMQRHLDGRDGSYRYLPKPALLLPELLKPDDTPQPELSCAEYVETAEQHLLINGVMANIVGQYVYKILHRQPVTSFLTVVNTTQLVMTSKPISRAELEVYLNLSLPLKRLWCIFRAQRSL